MNKLLKSVVAAGTGLLMVAGVSFAANGHTLFGDAKYVSPGNGSNRAVELTSDADPGYGGIDFTIPAGTTFAQLQTLSTDLFVESDDACLGGSPRFQINVIENGVEKNIHAYLGDEPTNVCPVGVWTNMGDELETGQALDTTQLTGGAFYDPYDVVLAKYGSLEVVGVQLVVDSGWAFPDGEQTVRVDNTVINTTTHTYEVPPTNEQLKEECKNGGWRNHSSGKEFRNQGQCVSFYASQGRSAQ
jgi:hypothetical protein